MTEPVVVTCVIPTYRRARLLRRAILSVMRQTWPHIRIAIYDNASEDETPAVVAELAAIDPRIDYHRHETNIGGPANFAFGLERVSTPLFSILCDDDVLLPGFYAGAAGALNDHPEAMFYCARTLVDHRIAGVLRHRNTQWPAGVYHPTADTVAKMIAEHFISTGTVFRAATQATVGPFMSHASDRSYVISAAALHPFVVSDEDQAVFTIHTRSFSGGAATNDRPAQDVDFVFEVHRQTLEGIAKAGMPLDRGLRDLVMKATARELLSAVVFQAVPYGRWAAVDAALERADEVRLSATSRLVLRTLSLIGRIPLVRSAARVTIAAITRALTRWRGRSTATRDFDRRVADYLAGGCEKAF